MSLHIFMVGNCWISSLQGSPGGKGGDVSGMMWTEEERWKPARLDECWRWQECWRSEWESECRDGRRKTCGARDVCISENGESSRGIANRLVCCNGWCLIAAEMDSTLQVLTECDTSGTWPQKEQIIALVWSGAWDSLQQMREMCRLGVNEIERGVL